MRLEVTSESGRFTLSTVPGSSIRIVFLQRCMHRSIRFSPINSGPSPASRNSTVGDSPFSALETHSRLNHSAYRIREPVILMTAGSEARLLCLFRRESFVAHAYFFHFIVQSSVWDLPAELTSRMRRLMRNLNKMNATSNMSPAAAAMLPTAAPVRPIRPGLPGSSLGLFSGGTIGVPVLNFGSTVMLRSADVSPLPGIEMRNGSQSYALLTFAELVRETR